MTAPQPPQLDAALRELDEEALAVKRRMVEDALDAALRELDEEALAVKRRMVEDALVAAGGSREAAAAALGMPVRRLQRLVAKVLGRERTEEMGRENGWPGVKERAAWARTYR